MSYWKTPAELGLNQEEINAKCQELWQIELERSKRNCPDCGVKVGEMHNPNCDVPHCLECGVQRLQCEHTTPVEWNGFWPGVKECYQQKLISCGNGVWMFDLNTYYENNQK